MDMTIVSLETLSSFSFDYRTTFPIAEPNNLNTENKRGNLFLYGSIHGDVGLKYIMCKVPDSAGLIPSTSFPYL
jgi:hypothetical protein